MNQPTPQDLLFDAEQYCWWARRLSPNALKLLENGFEGVFRKVILKLMPAHELGKHFAEGIGRPTKEIYSMAGLLLIAEFRDYTVKETARAYTFDTSIQYALDIPADKQYCAPRTVNNYRKLFREDELAQQVFYDIATEIVKELDLKIDKQRGDSTHVLSNMAIFTRHQLLATGVKRFLNALKKHHPDPFATVPEELRDRYNASDRRLYFGAVANPSKPTAEEKRKVISQIAEDMCALVERFDDDETISGLDNYQKMHRLLHEHFEIEIEKIPVSSPAPEPEKEEESKENSGSGNTAEKEPQDDAEEPPKLKITTRRSGETADGSKAHTLQNTSDESAGYDGHKGAGHKAHIAQAHPPLDENGDPEGPGILTAMLPDSAGNYDGDGLKPMLEKQAENGLLPDQMTLDSHYGSDANVCMAKDEFEVEVISPVSGARHYPESKEKPDETKASKPGTKAAELEAQKERLDQRREEQETDEWKETYSMRSGVEGVNRALDLTTGFKKLRVRGMKALNMALYLKGAGWNISAAAQIKAKRERNAAAAACFWLKRLIFRLWRVPTGVAA